MCCIEQANYRPAAYSPRAVCREAAPHGGVHMVSRFDILRVEADEFTWPESPTHLEVIKVQLELLGAVRPGQHFVQALPLWFPFCCGSAL